MRETYDSLRVDDVTSTLKYLEEVRPNVVKDSVDLINLISSSTYEVDSITHKSNLQYLELVGILKSLTEIRPLALFDNSTNKEP